MRRIAVFMTLILAVAFTYGSAFAADVTVPNNFTAGTTAHAGEVNENFSSLAADIDEYSPAVKQTSMSSWVQISAITDITSITVTPPRDGFIIVTAHGTFEFDQTSAAGIQAYVYLTDVSGGTSTDGSQLAGLNNTGFVTDFVYLLTSVHVNRVFPVTGGASYTFYLTGAETVGGAGCNTYVRAKLIALYVPNALP